jgi:hypothetical protein
MEELLQKDERMTKKDNLEDSDSFNNLSHTDPERLLSTNDRGDRPFLGNRTGLPALLPLHEFK